ncbi:hypothetical protein ASPFODRAFT_654209 [Aspergillus luchuensis CBS 106.47]|uniref:Uncharacterized protein n=1 Tax=Aspergillus luchuensis (strain CBS 106.47) TaxID=1137211 RepID=A0A1M3TEP1_ASPLC|nr:hypothetical protein ASPFODRAFT_654209 [Aspergillus luchuensis CBS 106.47]
MSLRSGLFSSCLESRSGDSRRAGAGTGNQLPQTAKFCPVSAFGRINGAMEPRVLNKLVCSAFLPIIAIFVIAMSHGSVLAKPPSPFCVG